MPFKNAVYIATASPVVVKQNMISNVFSNISLGNVVYIAI